jgi:hypothetical protein
MNPARSDRNHVDVTALATSTQLAIEQEQHARPAGFHDSMGGTLLADCSRGECVRRLRLVGQGEDETAKSGVLATHACISLRRALVVLPCQRGAWPTDVDPESRRGVRC